MATPRTYLDHNATAPLRPQARAAMIAALDLVGNASSVHAEGRRARGVIDRAREQVAALVGAEPQEVVFTSGATEANNWVMRAGWSPIVTAAIEHDSVLAPAQAASTDLVKLECDPDGVVAIGRVEFIRMANRTAARHVAHTLPHQKPFGLLSLQLANSETGVIQQLAAAVEVAHASGLRTHTDAVQAAGRIPVDFRALGVDFMSLSAHKVGGPKGIGALVIRDGLDIPAFIAGGGQEQSRRSGTENVAAIAGFGAAAQAAQDGLPLMAELAALRDRLEAGVREITPHVVIVGGTAPRLPNTSCIALRGADAATLLIKLDLAGIAVSAGSACSSGKIGESHVLAAMALDRQLAHGAIRVSLGHTTSLADVDRFLAAWQQIHRNAARPSGIEAPRRTQVTSVSSGRFVMASDPEGLTSALPPPQAGE